MIPYPGTFILNREGHVLARYFEEEYQYRNTAASIALKIGQPVPGMGTPTRHATPHFDVTAFLTDQTVAPGHRFSIVLDDASGGVPVASSAPAPRESPRGTHVSAEDAALVKRLLGGDEAAFTGLVEQYHGRLLRLAMVFVSDRASAEEVVQDTWVAVLTGHASFEGRSGLKTWIFSI